MTSLVNVNIVGEELSYLQRAHIAVDADLSTVGGSTEAGGTTVCRTMQHSCTGCCCLCLAPCSHGQLDSQCVSSGQPAKTTHSS